MKQFDGVIVRKLEYQGMVIEYKINKKNLKIVDSTRIKKKKQMGDILWMILQDCGEHYYWAHRDRSTKQLIREWRSHNIMYHIPLKFFKKHCKDCDLSIGESKFRLFVYSILGRF